MCYVAKKSVRGFFVNNWGSIWIEMPDEVDEQRYEKAVGQSSSAVSLICLVGEHMLGRSGIC